MFSRTGHLWGDSLAYRLVRSAPNNRKWVLGGRPQSRLGMVAQCAVLFYRGWIFFQNVSSHTWGPDQSFTPLCLLSWVDIHRLAVYLYRNPVQLARCCPRSRLVATVLLRNSEERERTRHPTCQASPLARSPNFSSLVFPGTHVQSHWSDINGGLQAAPVRNSFDGWPVSACSHRRSGWRALPDSRFSNRPVVDRFALHTAWVMAGKS